MGWDVEVRPLEQDAWPAWEKFVASAPGGSVYSLPGYLDALCTAGGGRFRILGVMRGEEIVGGVALYERTSRGGPFVSPRLLLYYNGVVVRRYETSYPSEATARHVKILTALETALSAMQLGSINLRSRALHDVRPFVAHGWSVSPSYSYVVPLDLAAAWGKVEQNLRRLIDRARNAGMTLSDADDSFDDFFRLHEATLDRHGAGVYLPREAFRTFCAALRGNGLGKLFQARTKDGAPAAAQLVLLGPHAVSHTACAGADAELNRQGASAFLRWSAFESLAALGYQGNDLTDATLNPVTHFKSQLGGALELSLVLQSPRSRRFVWNARADTAVARARGSAGALVRRIAGRGGNGGGGSA
jgi:GNAT acetyltransferase-like protein